MITHATRNAVTDERRTGGVFRGTGILIEEQVRCGGTRFIAGPANFISG